eukprot:NODE_7609_length_430_cov_102.258667.p4 GENE.NODE_7609_length_430_cov_102.258667~~NODE_7609_length_430_cov_102.258667.p4  ORF type:complete len:68 (+),score=1.53 NODE_7609_length_430_cov_102.258667:78-281(+)
MTCAEIVLSGGRSLACLLARFLAGQSRGSGGGPPPLRLGGERADSSLARPRLRPMWQHPGAGRPTAL